MATTKRPRWAIKPHSSKTVIATDKGWMIESTGEYLRRVYNLKQRLTELDSDSEQEKQSIPVSEKKSKIVPKSTSVVKEQQPQKRGRGRPPKDKPAE